jgi:hypothetical protein
MDTLRIIVRGYHAQKQILRALSLPVKEGLRLSNIVIKLKK